MESDGNIKITGAGTSKAQGLKKGSITNIELASKSIKAALGDAKRVAGSDIKRAIVSISGAYTKSLNSSGIVNIPNKEISVKEINRVMYTSLYNANIPNEYEVLHTLPFNFTVDDQDYIEDPLGMNASRLEVETHIITTQKSNLNNLKKAVRAAGVEVDNVILNGYASAIAVLNEDEKELGVAVIDMGGSTCNIVIHSGNSIRYNDFLGVGSNHITNDLSMALHTPLNVANNVKMQYGSLRAPSDDLIELPIIGDEETTHEVSLGVVHNVVYARVEETLMIIAQSLEKSGLKDAIGAGIVLTGGFSKMDGIRDLAVAIFDNMPVRIAKPTELDGLFDTLRDPAYSTVIGLAKYAAGSFSSYEIDVNKNMRYQNEMPSEPEPELSNLASGFESINIKNTSTSQPKEKVEEKSTATNLNVEQDKSKQAGFWSKFWNWATQLF
ncbi:MAG: cell division protein FtsA [Helicobacteraceae bacterium 4484_230]|nr:MAG: cell division protein FtsA [Helicobacteraceae bacterium 4484_230]